MDSQQLLESITGMIIGEIYFTFRLLCAGLFVFWNGEE
jgi:hypothetical protein